MKHYETPTADLFYRQTDVIVMSGEKDGNLGDIDLGGNKV